MTKIEDFAKKEHLVIHIAKSPYSPHWEAYLVPCSDYEKEIWLEEADQAPAEFADSAIEALRDLALLCKGKTLRLGCGAPHRVSVPADLTA